MDQRPPDGSEPPEPQQPPPVPPEPQPPEPAPTIISADPVLSGGAPGSAGPEVSWAAPPSPAEVPGVPGLVFAGVGSRIVALFIDSILLSIPLLVLTSILAPPVMTETVDGALDFETLYAVDPVSTIVYAGLSLVYFVGLWTSGGRATFGMRVMKLQVGSAFEGRTLSLGQAVTRWALLGQPLALVTIVPPLAALAGLLSFVWALVLLISTATSPTKQGIHDRVARSAVVQPAGARTSGLATACLVIVVVLMALAIISIVALIYLGGQISNILSEVGNSV